MPEFSTGVIISHQLAAGETAHANYEFITPAHLLSGLTKLQDVLDPAILRKLGLPRRLVNPFRKEAVQLLELFKQKDIDPRQVRHTLRERLGDGGFKREKAVPISRSDESRKVFRQAEEIAQAGESDSVALQHFFVALLKADDEKIAKLLKELDVDIEALGEASQALPAVKVDHNQFPTSYLDRFGVDLTQKAHDGDLSPVIGRKQEMMQVIRILSRDKKNNPVLIGEAGVGKTAIVEGLAQRIESSNIHPDFHDKRIVQLNAADLVAGTKYRGEFEERMQQLIEEAREAQDLILFIDEIHLLVGTGAGSGAMDAANILKPALARDEIKLIGATTIADYRKYIEKDTALERRFLPIRVEETSSEETHQILSGYRDHLAEKYQVTIRDDAIEAAVQLSIRYLPNRRLPDKAFDLLDDACSRARLGTQISFYPGADTKELAIELVTAETIREVVADQTGIPVAELNEKEIERIKTMADFLRERVVGQSEAIEAVTQVVQRHYAGLHQGSRPIGVFLFVGSTGVGKTELAKTTAEFLFHSASRLIRLDMGEYSEKHTVARLIGSPPGYVGFEEGGQLTEALRRNPFAVVLLDEIEKAHADVLNVLLSLLGEGRLTDGQGRTIDAGNVIFIMTSNLGYKLKSPDDQPAPPSRQAIESAVYAHFRPEFINRIDKIVFFQPLLEAQMGEIVNIQIKHLTNMLAERGIKLNVDQEAVEWLAKHGHNPQMGARPLIRFMNKELLNEIGGLLLSGRLKETSIAQVSLEQDRLRVRPIGAETI